MYSPFYTNYLNSIYPHRKYILSIDDIKSHIETLINNGIDTLENLKSTPLGVLQRKYFLNATPIEIIIALK